MKFKLFQNFLKKETKISDVREVRNINYTLTSKPIIEDAEIDDPTLKYAQGVRTIARSSVENPRNVQFIKKEYDLETIANAVQIDGLLRRSVSVFVEQIFKNGYEIQSIDKSVKEYIELRIKEIERLTGVSFYETIESIARQLVTYGNAYLIKVRKSDVSTIGRKFKKFNKQLNPVVGLFVADSTTISLGINEKGIVTHYKQCSIFQPQAIFKAEDVTHFTFDKSPSTFTGMPAIQSVLDDVRALRKLEEEVEILGFQYSVPLYLYKVGNKDVPPAQGEVDTVTATINNMKTYGMLVVPGHHDIEVPGNASSPVDLIGYINHFKKRVFSGLGVSPIAMGESDTSNRNTSQTLDTSMQNVTLGYQRIIKNRLEQDLLLEFILEHKKDPIKTDYGFVFPQIDLESQVKKENHLLGLFQGNAISRSEMRIEMGWDVKVNEKDMHLELVTIPTTEAGAAAKAAASPTKSQNSTSNKNKPANQYGAATRPKVVKNSMDSESFYKSALLIMGQDKATIAKEIFKTKEDRLKKLPDNEFLLRDMDDFIRKNTSKIEDHILSNNNES